MPCLVRPIFLLSLLSFVLADEPVFSPEDADRYGNGSFGRIPADYFQSADLPATRLLRRTWDEERCASDKYFFIATRGNRLPHSGPVIIDNDGPSGFGVGSLHGLVQL